VLKELGPSVEADVREWHAATEASEAFNKSARAADPVAREINNLLVNGETQHARDIFSGMLMPKSSGVAATTRGTAERALRTIVESVGKTESGRQMIGGAIIDSLSTMLKEDPAKFAENWASTRKLLKEIGALDPKTLGAYDEIATAQNNLQTARDALRRYEEHLKKAPSPTTGVKNVEGLIENPELREELDLKLEKVRKSRKLWNTAAIPMYFMGPLGHVTAVLMVGTKYLPVMVRKLQESKTGTLGSTMRENVEKAMMEIAADPSAVEQLTAKPTRERVNWLSKKLRDYGVSQEQAEIFRALSLAYYADQMEEAQAPEISVDQIGQAAGAVAEGVSNVNRKLGEVDPLGKVDDAVVRSFRGE
jgi:hypothetical protein